MRLFTAKSLGQLFHQNGFDVIEQRGIPAPIPLALGNNMPARLLTKINEWFIWLSKSLFSYQVFFVVRARPTLDALLKDAYASSSVRAESMKRAG
jgi:hypothetical protein